MCVVVALAMSGLSNFAPILLNWAFTTCIFGYKLSTQTNQNFKLLRKNVHCENIDFFCEKNAEKLFIIQYVSKFGWQI